MFRVPAYKPIKDYNKVVIVGEAPDYQACQDGVPFAGDAGRELTHMLAEAGIVREQCYQTNTFLTRPPRDDLFEWTSNKKEADARWQALGNVGKYPFKPLQTGKYLDPNVMGEVQRLHKEIVEQDPNIIIALGNTPLWALTGEGGIRKVRGTLLEADLGGDRLYKVLPSYHPSYVARMYNDRPIMVADIMKAGRESKHQDYNRPERILWLEPNLTDIRDFMGDVIEPAEMIGCDIETAYQQITCVGFGTAKEAICIPFVDVRKEGWNYWESVVEEVQAWGAIKHICEQMSPIKLFQNGMYDMIWLWMRHGITQNKTDDTMLRHHSYFSEMQKGLGFLGSIYTNETAWKRMRPRKLKTDKREDG